MFHLICNKLSPQRTICRPFQTYSPRNNYNGLNRGIFEVSGGNYWLFLLPEV